jgi:hypothetical protein
MKQSSECLMTSVASPAPLATLVPLTQQPFPAKQEKAMTRFAEFRVSFWKLALVTAALFAVPLSSGAGVIVSVTDLAVPVNRGAFFLGGEFSNVVAASWTQNESFSGVTIDASIVSIDSSFRNGTAYLMSMIGPGTTPASEIVPPVSFTAPVGNGFGEVPLTVLFSGLNLSAGTYNLVLTAPFASFTNITGSPLTWQVATTPEITTAPSVSIGDISSANSINSTVDPFAPASSFLPGFPDQLLFDVVSNVPEPQNAGIVLISLAALLLGAHKARNSRGATRNSGDATSCG